MSALHSVQPSLFDARIEYAPPHLVLRLRGELDLATAPFVDALGAACPYAESMEVDLTGLTFCDTAGLDALVHLRQVNLDRGCSVELHGACQSLLTLCRVLDVDLPVVA